MMENDPDSTISRLGECRIPSPKAGIRFVDDDKHVLYNSCSALADNNFIICLVPVTVMDWRFTVIQSRN